MKRNNSPQTTHNRWFHTFAALVLTVLIAIPTIFVFSPDAASVKLNKTSVTLNVKETCKLKVKNTSKKVKWTTSNKKVATVNQKGKVTAKKKGTATITAKVGGKKLTCKVTVKQPVTSVKLNKTSVTLKQEGASYTLKATVKPSTADTKDVMWTTSDKAVATVTVKGVVKAIGNGTAVITATAKDGSGKSASCTVKVSYTCSHKWNSGTITKAATCVADGVKTYTCKKCGATKTKTLAATGNHTWNSGVVTKAATCGTDGVKTYTCTVCGATKAETAPATGNHMWDGGVVTKEPTCAEAGIKTYTCTTCGATKTEAIAATGDHSWMEHPEEGHYGQVTVMLGSVQICNTCGFGCAYRDLLEKYGVTEEEVIAAGYGVSDSPVDVIGDHQFAMKWLDTGELFENDRDTWLDSDGKWWAINDDGNKAQLVYVNDCGSFYHSSSVPIPVTRYIVDKEAYTQCSVCGAIK